MTTLAPHGVLTLKGIHILQQNTFKFLVCKTLNPRFTRSTFNWFWHFASSYGYLIGSYWTFFIRFQHILITFLIFKIDLTTFVAEPVSILRAKLWNIVMKCKIVMFLILHPVSKNLDFWGSNIWSKSALTHLISFFQMQLQFMKFKFLIKVFFAHSNHCYNWEIGFLLFPW